LVAIAFAPQKTEAPRRAPLFKLMKTPCSVE
jgi:hypothetical protein